MAPRTPRGPRLAWLLCRDERDLSLRQQIAPITSSAEIYPDEETRYWPSPTHAHRSKGLLECYLTLPPNVVLKKARDAYRRCDKKKSLPASKSRTLSYKPGFDFGQLNGHIEHLGRARELIAIYDNLPSDTVNELINELERIKEKRDKKRDPKAGLYQKYIRSKWQSALIRAGASRVASQRSRPASPMANV